MSNERKAIVTHDDLVAVVAHLWNATRDDYVSRNTERPWLANVARLDDAHVFHHLAALAVACGFVESMHQVWADIEKDYGFTGLFDNDGE